MSISWYSIIIRQVSNNSLIFSGKFSVNNSTKAIYNFVNLAKTNINLLEYPSDNYQADNKFVSGKFTFKGTVVKSINAALDKKYDTVCWSIWQGDEDQTPNLSYLSKKNNMWHDLVDNSKNYGTLYSFTITSTTMTSLQPKTLFTRVYMKIYDKVTLTNVFRTTMIFDANTKKIINLQGSSTTNILTYSANDNYSDYKFINNNFTMAGTTISSIPALNSTYGATEWQLWNYNGTNCLSYKNASNEWIAITPLSSNNRYAISFSNKPFP